jgi:putative hydrolase of the HAD superfamily
MSEAVTQGVDLSMRIRAALFDLGNTLVHYYQPADFLPILRRSLAACLLTLGCEPLSREAQTTLLHEALELNQERADLAVWPLEQRLRMLFHNYAPDTLMTERLSGAFLAPILATAQVNSDALAVLAELKRRGVKTALVSNTPWGSSGRAWRDELQRHNLLDAVDAVVFCMDVGWRKPHPTPFRRALEMLGASADDAVFVGDDPVWDIQGANAAGLRPILLAGRSPPAPHIDATIAASLREVLVKIDRLNGEHGGSP